MPCAAFVPPTSVRALGVVELYTTFGFLSVPGGLGDFAYVGSNTVTERWLELSSSQQFAYRLNATGGSLDVDIYGYWERR